jgi:hypothetical protein
VEYLSSEDTAMSIGLIFDAPAVWKTRSPELDAAVEEKC